MNKQPKSGKGRWSRCWRSFLVLLLLALAGGLVVGAYLWLVSPRRHFRDGCEAFRRGDLDAVRTAAEAIRGVPGYGPHVHLLEGMILLGRQEYVPAIVEFGYAKDHPQTAPLAYALSGQALYHTGRLRDATRILARAVKLDPNNTDARRWLAATYFDIGAMNRAIDQLQVVAEQDPDDPRPRRSSGSRCGPRGGASPGQNRAGCQNDSGTLGRCALHRFAPDPRPPHGPAQTPPGVARDTVFRCNQLSPALGNFTARCHLTPLRRGL